MRLFWIKVIEKILVQCISASVEPGVVMKLLNLNVEAFSVNSEPVRKMDLSLLLPF